MKKYLIIYFLLMMTSQSCQNHIQESLYDKINLSMGNENKKTINLREYLDFDWDSAFIFQSSISCTQVNEVTGIEIENYTKEGLRIIFIKNNKVVLYDFTESEWDTFEFRETSDLKNKIFFIIPQKGYLVF